MCAQTLKKCSLSFDIFSSLEQCAQLSHGRSTLPYFFPGRRVFEQ